MYFLASLLFFSAPYASATIGGDLNCTTFNGTQFVWTPAAVACDNTISDSACQSLYPTTDPLLYPAVGSMAARPNACYTTASVTPAAVVTDMKTAAIANCPKTCGYCCQTDAYSCSNVAYPRLNCNTITSAQCNSVAWRTIIATDCPSACGFCNSGGCVDAVTNCGNDLSICNTVGMQDFVNQYCQKTCSRCPSTTTSGSASSTTGSSSSCSSYNSDSSTSCSAWAKNGFCSNTFYTYDQRKARCATTCKLC